MGVAIDGERRRRKLRVVGVKDFLFFLLAVNENGDGTP